MPGDGSSPRRSGRALRLAAVWGPAVGVMVAIFAASSIENVSQMPADLLSDKVVHALAYGLLGACLLRGLAAARLANVTAATATRAWALSVIYGATDEWHQSFVPGRTMAVDDWVADAAGAAAAVLVALAARKLFVLDRTV